MFVKYMIPGAIGESPLGCYCVVLTDLTSSFAFRQDVTCRGDSRIALAETGCVMLGFRRIRIGCPKGDS